MRMNKNPVGRIKLSIKGHADCRMFDAGNNEFTPTMVAAVEPYALISRKVTEGCKITLVRYVDSTK